jgi:hypothetical protein
MHLHTADKLRWLSLKATKLDPIPNKGHSENIGENASWKNLKLSTKGCTGG